MSSPDERPTEDERREAEGYFRRDVDEFHREANVLAGQNPQGVSADPPSNLGARRLIVFAILVLVGVVATALAMGLMAIPDCENPQYNWMPCIPNF